MYCVVKDCGSVWNPSSNVIFHNFPKDSEKRQKWLSSITLKGTFYESAKICSLHFKPEDYDPSRPKRLLIGAVPVYSVQLCSCGNAVKACTTPFKCSVSPDVKIETKTDTCSILTEKVCSNFEKEMYITHSENIVVNENEPPAKRRCLKDFNVQCNIKTLREKCLLQKLFVPKHPIIDICMDLHETEIIKFISNMFFKIRIHSFLKNHTQKLLGDIRTKRQKLHKSILFSHV